MTIQTPAYQDFVVVLHNRHVATNPQPQSVCGEGSDENAKMPHLTLYCGSQNALVFDTNLQEFWH
jgi:hypothetical protein